MLQIIQFIKQHLPALKGFLFKLFYSSRNLSVGKNFRCDSFPDVTIERGAKISIGDNVIFRKDVEMRAHATSSTIIENECRIDRGVRFLAANQSQIRIKKGARIGLYCVFNGGDSISVGEKSLVSGFVYLQTSMHNYEKKLIIQEQGYNHAPIVIGDDAWIGAHAVILPGCTIGNGSVVGSNAVVTESVSDNIVVGGIPAKILKERN